MSHVPIHRGNTACLTLDRVQERQHVFLACAVLQQVKGVQAVRR